MQCPKCAYEPTLKQQLESAGKCTNCGVYYSAGAVNSKTGGAQMQLQRANSISGNSVVIGDIKMPFLSMVTFMVKWALAAIPAMIIIAVIVTVLSGTLSGLIFSFTGGISGKKILENEAAQVYKEPSFLKEKIDHISIGSLAVKDSKLLVGSKSSVTARVMEKSSKPMATMEGKDKIAIDTVYQNNTGRKIIMIDGVVSIFNFADEHLLDFNVLIDGAIPADSTEFRRGNLLDYDSSQDELLRVDTSLLKTEMLIKRIIFSDGEIYRL